VLPGLTECCLADEIVLNLEIFKIIYWINIQIFAMFIKGTMLSLSTVVLNRRD